METRTMDKSYFNFIKFDLLKFLYFQCPITFDGGVKTRNFKCIKELEFGQVINQPTQKCIKNKPKTLKICNSRKCYHHDKINKIFQSNSIDALAKISFDAPKCFDGKSFDSKSFNEKSYDNNDVMNRNDNYMQNEPDKRIVLNVN